MSTAVFGAPEFRADVTEAWTPALGFEGFYEVSDQGRVRSLERTVTYKDGRRRHHPEQLLKPTAHPSGYLMVDLRIGGKRWPRRVHRLVLEAFVGPRPDGFEGCHGNGVQTDNRLVNLRWDTAEANRDDARRHGTHLSVRTHCRYGHPLAEPNLVPSNVRAGGRACLACSRARAFASNRGELITQELRDHYFAALAA